PAGASRMRGRYAAGWVDGFPDQRQVLHELPEGGFALLRVAQAQQRRRMKRREDVRRERAFHEAAALRRDLEVLADDGLCRRGAEADDDLRLDRLDLALEPLVAGVDLALRGRLVQAPFAARLPLEMLHGVGDVEVLARHIGRLERAVEKPAGGADERQALPVLLVARLLAHQHHPGVRIAGAEYRLRRIRPQWAVVAGPGLPAKRFQGPGHPDPRMQETCVSGY